MSRFPELFEEAIERVVIGEALVIEALARAHRAAHRRAAARAARGGADPRAVPARAAHAGDGARDAGDGRADRHRRGASEARRPARRRRRGDRHQRVPVRAGARPRPARPSGCSRPASTTSDVERILELVPLATHNQRGRGTLYVGTGQQLNAEQLVDIVESSMSSPVYELLKRPDELFVVEHAHLQPRFVEDSVRIALATTLERYPELDDARLPLLAPGQPRDDPPARRARRAVRHRRRAPRRARRRRRAPPRGTRPRRLAARERSRP